MFRRDHIDACAAQYPQITIAVLIQVGIVRKREFPDGCHPVIRCHSGKRIAGNDPVKITGTAFSDTHDDPGSQPFFCADLADPILFDDINTASVRAGDQFLVISLCDREDQPDVKPFRLSICFDNAVSINDIDTVVCGCQHGAVPAFAHNTDCFGIQAVFLRKLRDHSIVITDQTVYPRSTDPEPVFTVPDDGTDTYAIQVFQQIRCFYVPA